MNKSAKSLRIIALSVILYSLVPYVWAQGETIKVRSDLVEVPTVVMDHDGRHVTGLRRENFLLFEDGFPQEISFFESVDVPVTVLLLLDRSGSMSNELSQMAEAANVFFRQLLPDDQVIVATFSDSVEEAISRIKVKDLQQKVNLSRFGRDRSTQLFEGMDWSLRKMKKIPGRKAIILFSDGLDSGLSELSGGFPSAKSNLRDAEEGESVIYTVAFDTMGKVPPEGVDRRLFRSAIENAKSYLDELSRKTGGRSFQIEAIADLTKTFVQIAHELRRQYYLGYYPSRTGKDGERRKIKVTVNIPNTVVRSRTEIIYTKKIQN